MADFYYKHAYPTILVIGNGFDLDMGLKSSWIHFMESKEFTLILKTNRLAIYLKKQQRLKNWIDIEAELKIYSKRGTIDKLDFHSEYFELLETLNKFLKTLSYQTANESSISFQLLQKFFSNDGIGESTLIIDFNYTDTIKICADQIGVIINENRASNCHYIRVHGSLDQNNIVVGVEDGADINDEHSFIRKSYHDACNPNDFGLLLKQSQNIVFFGHSLGTADYHYFNEFFQSVLDEQESKNMFRNQKRNLTFIHKDEVSKIDLFTNLNALTKGNMKELKNINVFNQYQTSSLKELPF